MECGVYVLCCGVPCCGVCCELRAACYVSNIVYGVV